MSLIALKRLVIQFDLADAAKRLQLYAVDNGGYPQNGNDLVSAGVDPPLRKQTFARNPNPYLWVLYCTDGLDYILAARQVDTTNWYAIGSSYQLQTADVAGTNGDSTTTCKNLGMPVTTTSVWVRSSAGWHANLK